MYSKGMKNFVVGIIGGKGKLGSEVAKLCDKKILIQKNTDLASSIQAIDIFLDVSSANAICSYLPLFISHKKPVVIGSTGHSKETIEAIHNAAKYIPVLVAPNFSKGVFLLKQLLSQIGISPSKIEETHHTEKKDAPSGTAKALSNLFAEEIPITSYRKENVFGDHCVTFALPGEEITLTHRALSRELFAKGAILALSFLYQKEKGLYTMEQVFKDER